MSADAFTVLADPTRRRILTELTRGERAVGQLASTLGLSQPATSKHLRVLKDGGFVVSEIDAQRRMYRLDPSRPGGLGEVDAWLEPFRQFWTHHLDALDRHLTRTARTAPAPTSGPPPSRRPRGGTR